MAPNGKRKHDAIDLTGDDDVAMSSQSHAPPSQAERDSWLEELEGEDIVVSTQDGDNESAATYQLYSVLSSKIGGVQYYQGIASNGEHVILRREPSNQYDNNAIRVENVQRAQIGHIPRTMAAKLAKYMDSGALLVEGSLSGTIGHFDCPISLNLFGTSDPVERANLRIQMKEDRLPTSILDEKEKEAKRRKAEELKRIAAAKKAKGGKKGASQYTQQGLVGSQSQGNSVPDQSLDDLIDASQRFDPREMGEVAEKFGAAEDVLADMPLADCPSQLSTELLPYQRQALAWLLEKEDPKIPEGSEEAVQLWKRDPHDRSKFTNMATNFSIKGQNPKLGSGGILSDDMGLGKTIEMISLMVADPMKSEERKTTLIVCPVGLMSNWSGQIAQHLHKHSALNVLTYHGTSKKKMSPSDFAQYDVVITSYGTLAAEYFSSARKSKETPPLPRSTGIYSIEWRRIILDEGHTIRNPQTKSALAANNVAAQSRWVLTGTPIINTLRDLYSLVRFIRLSGGLEQLDIFNRVLIRPLKQGDPNANLLLQALMTTISLRRKKEMKFIDLRLPEKTEYVHRFQFASHEKEKYEALQSQAKGLLHDVRKGKDGYQHLLEILLRLRQVCNHWKLCAERVTDVLSILESQKTVDLTPENRAALQSMLQLSIESHEDCAICLESLHNPVITNCAHVFGAECIERVIETQHKCPMCRADLPDNNILVRPAVELGEDTSTANSGIDPDTSSSKIEEMVKILHASQKKDPTTKTVIFSQWTSFLNILQARLTTLYPDTHIARIDGTMNPRQRDAAQDSLNNNPNCTILLASLAVCSIGLNLVAANQVILSDSWWAPAIEDQAVDRVHRLGQKRPCTIWRLVVEETVEESVLQIQGEKRKLMSLAFAEKVKQDRKESRIADIERLLG